MRRPEKRPKPPPGGHVLPTRSQRVPRELALERTRRQLTLLTDGDRPAEAKQLRAVARQLLALARDDADRRLAYRALAATAPVGSQSWSRHYRNALAAARTAGTRAPLLYAMGDQLLEARKWAAALERLREAARLFEEAHATAELRGWAYTQMGRAQERVGRPGLAVESYRRAIAVFRSDRLVREESYVAHELVLALSRCDPGAVTWLGYAVCDLDESEGDARARSLYKGVAAYRQLRELDRALELTARLREHLGPAPSTLLVKTINQQAGIMLVLEDAEAAVALHREALEVAAKCPGFPPSVRAAVLADLAYAMVRADDPDVDDLLLATAQACDEVDDPGHAIWAWSELAKRLLDAAEDESSAIECGRAALAHIERAQQHARDPRYRDERYSRPNLTKLEARAHFLAGDREAAAERALSASREAVESDSITRARCAQTAAELLLKVDRVPEARTQASVILSVLGGGRYDDEEAAGLARDLIAEAHLLELRCLRRSPDEHDQRRAVMLERRLVDGARAAGDHQLAGRILNALDDATDELVPQGPDTKYVRLADYQPPEYQPPDPSSDWVEPEPFLTPPALALLEEAEQLRAADELEGAIAAYERALAHQLAYQLAPDGSLHPALRSGACQLIIELVSLRLDQGDRAAELLRLLDDGWKIAEHPSQQMVLLCLRADAYFKAGAMRAAVAAYDEALELMPADLVDARVASLCSGADALLRLGRYQAALDRLDAAEALAPEGLHARVALLQARASLEHRLGRDERAVLLLREGLAHIADSACEEDSGHVRAMLLVDLGHATAEPTESILHYEAALEIIERRGDRLHMVPAREGLLLARLAAGQLADAEARRELEWLLAQRRTHGDRDGELATLSNLAGQMAALGTFAIARSTYDRAIALARELDATWMLIALLTARAGVRDDSDLEHAAAVRGVLEACALVEAERMSLTGEEDRGDLLATGSPPFALLAALRFEEGDVDGMLDATERVRALGLSDLITAQDLRAAASPEARAEEEAAWRDLEELWRRTERDTALEEPQPDLALALDAGQQRLRRAQARIRCALPALTSAERVRRATNAELCAGPLAGGAALIVYTVAGDAQILGHCITDTEDVGFVVEDPDATLQCAHELATDYATEVAGEPVDHARRAEQSLLLYRQLLQPMRDTIAGRPLVLVPDGVLHQIPFAALLTDSPGVGAPPWLVRDHAIRIVPSASVLLDLHERAPLARGRRALLAFADPELGAREPDVNETLLRVADETELPRLREARAELRAIARAIGAPATMAADAYDGQGIALRVGPRATREEFERMAPEGARWLHLACHALVDPERPWASRVVLAAGAESQPDLTAAVILRRRAPCDLVVLSCCNTGVGRIVPGEGVLGLPRAFLAAGARAVCATLWPVFDEAGPPLMFDLYRGLARGWAPWDALRVAQVAQADAGVSPARWASYVTIG